MLSTRSIGRLLVGKVAPWQAGCGAFLGMVAGFTPLGAAPGLHATLVVTAVLLNVNLVMLGAALAVARMAALLLAPALFAAGQLVLDGPAAPFMRRLVNAPVLAWFGFDSYLAAGGMFLGAALACLAAPAAASALRRFRTYLAALDENSPAFREISSGRMFKAASFVLLGGITKFSELRAMPRAKPVRPLGAVLLALTLVLGVTLNRFFAGPIVTYVLQDTLERFNGATVDLGAAELDAKAGRLVIHHLALADPNALERDLFRAARLEADIGLADLLRKRLRIDRLVAHGASSGEPRALRGVIVGEPPRSAPKIDWPDAKAIEDYLRNAAAWKERLAQARRWLAQLETASAHGYAPEDGEQSSARQRLEAAAHGYAQIKATHLVESAPTLLVSRLEITDLTVDALPGERFRFTGRNLSTTPALVAEPFALSLAADSGAIRGTVQLAGRTGGANLLELQWQGLPAEKLSRQIAVKGEPVFAGGTLDLRFAGALDPRDATINVPVRITLHDTTLHLGGRTQPVRELSLPFTLTGPLDNPAIRIESQALGRALAQAGAGRLLDETGERLGDKLGPAADALLDRLRNREPPKN